MPSSPCADRHPTASQDASPPQGIHVDVDACLARRPAGLACGACVEVCPAQALNWADDSVSVGRACIGCGRCAAACPSGAISVAGFEALRTAPQAVSGERFIECARVPPRLRRAGALTVPCLGGVTVVDLLSMAARDQVAVLMDRGWCSACPAAGEMAATPADTVDDAGHDLHLSLGALASGVRLPLPRIDHAPLPPQLALAPPREVESGGAAIDRRGFFASFRAGPRSVVAAASRPRHSRTRAACRPSAAVARHQTHRADALAALAQRLHQPLLASAFPAVTAHRNCCHEGVCAAGCPSGALRLVDDGAAGQVGLDFEAALCLGCGLCAALCPQQALSVTGAGSAAESWQPGPQPLTRHALRRCHQCADEFLPRDPTDRCPRCAMALEQGRNLFGALSAGSARRKAPPTS